MNTKLLFLLLSGLLLATLVSVPFTRSYAGVYDSSRSFTLPNGSVLETDEVHDTVYVKDTLLNKLTKMAVFVHSIPVKLDQQALVTQWASGKNSIYRQFDHILQSFATPRQSYRYELDNIVIDKSGNIIYCDYNISYDTAHTQADEEAANNGLNNVKIEVEKQFKIQKIDPLILNDIAVPFVIIDKDKILYNYSFLTQGLNEIVVMHIYLD